MFSCFCIFLKWKESVKEVIYEKKKRSQKPFKRLNNSQYGNATDAKLTTIYICIFLSYCID